MSEQLEREIAAYNELVGQLAALREQLNTMEGDRLKRLGRIELLNEQQQIALSTNGQTKQDAATIDSLS